MLAPARHEYRCSSCLRWQAMSRDVEGIVVPLLGARELTMGEPRPDRYLHVPTCLGLARHELCDECRLDDDGCLACARAASRQMRVDQLVGGAS